MNPALGHLLILAGTIASPTLAQELSPQARFEQRLTTKLNGAPFQQITLKSCVLTVSTDADITCDDPRHSYMLRSHTEILHLSEITEHISSRVSAFLDGYIVLEFQFDPEVAMWLNAYSGFSSDIMERYPNDLPERFSKFEELSSEFFAKSGLKSREVTEYCGAELTAGISPHFGVRVTGDQNEDLASELERYVQSYCAN